MDQLQGEYISVADTGAALAKNNYATAELTTANSGTFTSSSAIRYLFVLLVFYRSLSR